MTTPRGALNDDTRNELVTKIGEIVDEIFGTIEGRFNHWTMLYNLNDEHWAGGGQIFPFEAIKEAA